MNAQETAIVTFAGLSLTAAIGSSILAASADQSLKSERARTVQLESDTAHLARLRSARVNAQAAEPPEDDVLRSVSASIRRAGLPTRSFSGLATSGDQAVRGRDGYRKKSYRLDLQAMDVTDLGGFLEIWRSSEPLWAIEEIELRRQAAGRNRAASEGFTVSVTIASVYAAHGSTVRGSRP